MGWTCVGGRRQDSGNRGGNLCLWKGGGRDVLSCNVFSRIESKMLVDKGVLGRRGEEVLLFVFTVLGLVGSDVGKSVEVVGRSGGDGATNDNISGAVRDIEEGVVFQVVKGGPDKFWRWEARRGSDGRWGAEGVGTGTWVVPSVEIGLENLKDSVSNVLLIDIIKG